MPRWTAARNLSIIALVLLLLAGSAFVISTKRTVLGLDLQGGVQLVYKAEPTRQQPTIDPEAMQRSIDLMQQRAVAAAFERLDYFQVLQRDGVN